MYFLQLLDTFGASYGVVFIGMMLTISVAWVYGMLFLNRVRYTTSMFAIATML